MADSVAGLGGSREWRVQRSQQASKAECRLAECEQDLLLRISNPNSKNANMLVNPVSG